MIWLPGHVWQPHWRHPSLLHLSFGSLQPPHWSVSMLPQDLWLRKRRGPWSRACWCDSRGLYGVNRVIIPSECVRDLGFNGSLWDFMIFYDILWYFKGFLGIIFWKSVLDFNPFLRENCAVDWKLESLLGHRASFKRNPLTPPPVYLVYGLAIKICNY